MPNSKTLPRIKPVDSLSHESTYGGLVIGDNWVVMGILFVDRLGHVIPIRVRRSFFEATPGEDPSLPKIEEAIRHCWSTIGGGADSEYSRFVVCLPPRATQSRHTSSRVSTRPEGRPFLSDRTVVTAQHLRELDTRISRDGVRPRYAVADMVPLAYQLDNQHRTSDPVGRQTELLTLQAHLVLSDSDTAQTILDCLRTLDIRTDVFMSPHMALSGNLAPVEKTADTISVDVDRLTTACSFFRDGKLIHTEWVEGGSYEVLEGASERLNTNPDELMQWLNDREDVAPPGAVDDDLLLPLYPRWRNRNTSLVDLDHAARKAANGIVTQILAVVETARASSGTDTKRVILTGDDSMTLRAVRANLQHAGLMCEWRLVEEALLQEDTLLAVPGFSRLVGMMKVARAQSGRQPFLDEYNEALVDRVGQRIQAVPAHMKAWASRTRAPRNAAPAVRVPSRSQPAKAPLAGVLRQLLW